MIFVVFLTLKRFVVHNYFLLYKRHFVAHFQIPKTFSDELFFTLTPYIVHTYVHKIMTLYTNYLYRMADWINVRACRHISSHKDWL